MKKTEFRVDDAKVAEQLGTDSVYNWLVIEGIKDIDSNGDRMNDFLLSIGILVEND